MSFPTANRRTVDNISRQLLSVPSFYFKVCEVMQEMLLPVPFDEDASDMNEWAVAFDFVSSRVNSLVRNEVLSPVGLEGCSELIQYFREKQLKEIQGRLMTDSFDAVKPLVQTALKLIEADQEQLKSENARVKRRYVEPQPPPSKAMKYDTDESVYDYREVQECSDYQEDVLQAAEIRAQCVESTGI